MLARFLYVLVLVFSSQPLFAQMSNGTVNDWVKLNGILPPSPTSFEFSKYVGINAPDISGAINKQIPLLTYKAGHLSLPVSLSYVSNGLKVDQISNRTGMAWNLNIGGVITRMVRGVPDEVAQNVTPPSDLTTPSQGLLDFLSALSDPDGPIDNQPDIYSFNINGQSGKFILLNNVIKLITYSNLKIEKISGDFDFKITFANGDQYFFGGSSATESSRNDNNCTVHNPQFIKNAWYLKRAVAYTKEVIDMTYASGTSTYEAGLNQSMIRKIEANCTLCPNEGQSRCIQSSDQTCISYLTSHFVYLTDVRSNVLGRLKFYYDAREDVTGELLLRSIRYFSNNSESSLLRRFDLDYDLITPTNQPADSKGKRYFLTHLTESGNSGAMLKHSFAYDEPSALPARLSYSQDLYGYFNGKSNLYMIPNLRKMPGFPLDLADRDPDPAYAKKGLLTKITYPTGGYEAFEFEPHSVYVERSVPPTMNEVVLSGYGLGTFSSSEYIMTFTPGTDQKTHIALHCEYTGSNVPDDNIANRLKVEGYLIDQSNGTQVWTGTIRIGENLLSDDISIEQGRAYVFKIRVFGSSTFGSARLEYSNSSPNLVMENSIRSGLRIAKNTVTAGPGVSPMIKRYFYGSEISNYQNSTGVVSEELEYYDLIKSKDPCEPSISGFTNYKCEYNAMYSNSVNSTYLQDSPVQYRQVTESWGEGFENGGESHTYIIDQDTPGQIIWGDRIKSAPLSNFGIMNGLETETVTLGRTGAGLNKRKVISRKFKESALENFDQKVYVSRKKSNAFDISGNDIYDHLTLYDAVSYSIFGKWLYADSITTTTLDVNGANPIIETAVYHYENPVHALPSSVQTKRSTGDDVEEVMRYSGDVAVLDDLSQAQIDLLNNMSQVHRVDQPIRVTKYVNDAVTQKQEFRYKSWNNGLILADLASSQYRTGPMEGRIIFQAYSDHGNILSQAKVGGSTTSYKWGYGDTYPIVQAENALVNEFFAENFEDNSTADSTSGAHTGLKSTNNAAVDWIPPNSRQYVISYWYKASGAWHYSGEQAYNGNHFTMAGGVLYDDIRVHPRDAMITSYTYKPMVGMTSMTDAKGLTTYYEYDDLQRLLNIKDHEGNIVKHFDYHFAGQGGN